MQAVLSEVPTSPQDWEVWSRAHRESHAMIREAIRTREENPIDLPDYPLEPMEQAEIGGFLQRNQRMHVDFNGVLQLTNVDLSSVDFTDPEQLATWIYLHWSNHRDAEAALGIGS